SIQITVVPPFWQTWWFATLMALSVAGIIVSVYERRVGRLKRARAMQEAFSKQLIASQENERKRIAAELHDSHNQSLVIIKNRAALSLSEPEDHERAFEQLQEIADTATQAIDEVREIAYNLRPYQLDRLGLARSIESMLRKASSADSLRFEGDLDAIDGLFSDEAEINFYRIVQESVNNILKHSGASEAKVTVRKSDRALELMIWDNGKGFAPGGPRRGFGLTSIAERARMLGGSHQIETAPGQGTTIRIRIGLKDGRHEQ
ncbi:MAG TPA: sensor histidine kinase, partial [Blastocatellia bacterium]|nr:sensor histidine kinase [Blastocatellia bacterium]